MVPVLERFEFKFQKSDPNLGERVEGS